MIQNEVDIMSFSLSFVDPLEKTVSPRMLPRIRWQYEEQQKKNQLIDHKNRAQKLLIFLQTHTRAREKHCATLMRRRRRC